MEKVERKKRKERRVLRKIIPPLLLILAVAVAVIGWKTREEARTVEVRENILTAGTIENRNTDEVASIRVELADGTGWYAEQTQSGILTEQEGFDLAQSMSKTFLSEAAVIGYEDIFTENPEDYMDRLDEFGLSEPASVVTVTYSDQSTVTMRFGNKSTETEAAYYYMIIDGRDPLYAVSVSAAEDWKLSRSSLYAIEQPLLQTARMDHLIFEGREQTAEWILDAEVTDSYASDSWVLVSPVVYPADGTEMTSFLKNIGSLHLGAYVAPATEDHLTEYGFDEPRMVITLHMAQGMAALTAEDGTVSTELLDEETVTLTVGGQKSELVSYVRYRDDIYLVSQLTLGPVLEKDPKDTMTRYPVLVAAEDLTSLTIEDHASGEQTVYTLIHEPQADEGEEEIIRCYENDQEIPFDTFDARYLQMVVCTVSGELPEDYEVGPLLKTYVLETRGGKTHRIRLYEFDSLHDAIQVDDYPILFYLIKGGLGM